MTIPAALRERVRQRADYACEFCGIGETDMGGRLTVDHFHSDYWPSGPDASRLWNPRQEPFSHHFLELDDGKLQPLTETGIFTLRRLRLNHPPLVAHRRRVKELRQLARYRDLAQLLERLLHQQAALLEEQQSLLQEQKRLMQILVERQD